MKWNVEEVKKEILGGFNISLEDFVNQTKSPIEELFILYWWRNNPDSYATYRLDRLSFEYPAPTEAEGGEQELELRTNFYNYSSIIIPQFKFTKFFTVDFLFYLPEKNIKLVIECDGHDFHEKTKEQARQDKQRDRWLITNNIFVLRYTGSEIYNHPGKATIEVENFLIAQTKNNEI